MLYIHICIRFMLYIHICIYTYICILPILVNYKSMVIYTCIYNHIFTVHCVYMYTCVYAYVCTGYTGGGGVHGGTVYPVHWTPVCVCVCQQTCLYVSHSYLSPTLLPKHLKSPVEN